MIKAKVIRNKKWTFLRPMEEYFKLKEVKKEDAQPEDISETPISGVNNTKCRLCQQHDIDFILENNNELCGKISECFAINVRRFMLFIDCIILIIFVLGF